MEHYNFGQIVYERQKQELSPNNTGMYLLTFSGPQGIGARTNDEPLEAGVFVSDGIRYFMFSTNCKNITGPTVPIELFLLLF